MIDKNNTSLHFLSFLTYSVYHRFVEATKFIKIRHLIGESKVSLAVRNIQTKVLFNQLVRSKQGNTICDIRNYLSTMIKNETAVLCVTYLFVPLLMKIAQKDVRFLRHNNCKEHQRTLQFPRPTTLHSPTD